MWHREYPHERQTPGPSLLFPVLHFYKGIPTDPLHLAFWKFPFLQLKECLCSRLRFTFMPCATIVTDITWQNTKKEGILSFATRLSLVLQVHWENTLTRNTNPPAFNGRAASSAGDQISLLPSNFALWLHWNKIRRQHSDGAIFHDTKARLLLGAYTSEGPPSHGGKQETQGHGQVHPGDAGIPTLELLTFIKDGICYYLLPPLLWLMNLITWSSEFNNSKGKCTARPSGFGVSFYLHQ